MRYRVLGPLRLADQDGRAVSIRSRKQRLLLAALLAHAGRVVSADRLVDLLWHDDPPADPAGALHTHVSRLRRALRTAGVPDDAPDAVDYGYRLDPGDSLDAARFEALLDDARDAEPQHALALLDEALDLWHGDAYAEFADRLFFSIEAERLAALRTTARERRAEALLALGRTRDALPALQQLIHADPLRERPHALLMEALARDGRQGEALGVYQQLRRRLSEELGIEPSPAIRELERRILRHDTDGDAADRPATLASAVTLASPSASASFAATHAPIPPGPDVKVSFLEHAGRQVAYGTAGDGPPLVVCPAWCSNLGVIAAGADPRSALLARLAARYRLIMHDRCGTGLTGGAADDPSLDHDVAELEALFDHLRLEQVPLLALSRSGPIALAFAARHPDRVSRLVLFGTYASGPATFTNTELTHHIIGLVRASWGIGSRILADMIAPDAPPALAASLARTQRESATPDVAARLLKALFDADVHDLLPDIRAPALVLHYEHDRAIPFAGGRDLAAHLPDARLVPLAGRNHLPGFQDMDRVVTLIADFLDA